MPIATGLTRVRADHRNLLVPITGGKANLWFVRPGGDPANTPTGTCDVSSLLITSSDTGRHTALTYDFFGGSAVNVISADDAAVTPPAGKANIIFNTAPVLEMFAGYGFNYGRTGLCLDWRGSGSEHPAG